VSAVEGGRLILPPNYTHIEGPLLFLAGPIQGAPRWQDRALDFLHGFSPDLTIASPRRILDRSVNPERIPYNEQVDWESHHLRRAAVNGAILFWLAKEFEHQCDRAFAQTSRFELGEWKMRHERDGVKLIVGVEEGFTNERYIRRRLSQDCPDIRICQTLEETCAEAISKIYN
jgi:hypothetical protein